MLKFLRKDKPSPATASPIEPAESDEELDKPIKTALKSASLADIQRVLAELDDVTSTKPAPAQASAPAEAVTAEGKKKAQEISLYKSLLSGLYDGILVFDAKGTIIGSNPRAEMFFGYNESEFWGMGSQDLVVGMNTRMLHKLHEHAQSGRFTVVNGTCKRKDGTTFPAEIAISRIRLLNEGDLIFSVRNLERREKVRETRELNDEAVRNSGAGIVICGTDGAIEFVNPAFLKLLDAGEEAQVLKHMIGDFCTSYEAVKAMIHSPSAQGTWLGTIELQTPKGLCRKVMLAAALSHFRKGAEPHLVLTMIPIPMAIA